MVLSRVALILATSVLFLAPVGFAAPTFVVNSIADVPQAAGSSAVCETAPGNGVCTLRAAVMAANRVAGGHAIIRVPAGLYYLLPGPPDSLESSNEANGDLDVFQGMTIVGEGPSATIIDGNHATPLFFVAHPSDTGNDRIEGLTLRGGSSIYEGGAVHLDTNIAHGFTSTTTLENVVVSDSHGGNGGGIAAVDGASLVLRHCIVRDNAAAYGGGVYGTYVTISDSMINNNTAATKGGGVYLLGFGTIERTSVTLNLAGDDGGGVYADGLGYGVIDVVNSTIETNAAGGYGGGVAVGGGAIRFVADTLANNEANYQHANQPFVAPGGRFGGGLGVRAFGSENVATIRNSALAYNNSGNYTDGGYMADEAGLYASYSLDYDLCASEKTCNLSGIQTHVNQNDLDPLLGIFAQWNGGFGPDELPPTDPASPLVRAIPPANCIDALGVPLAADGRGYARVGNCDIGAVQTGAGYAPEPLLGSELIRNGGATGNELGEAATDASGGISPPYWAAGGLTQVVYGTTGGFPLRSDAPADSGAYFFAGGPVTYDQSEIQTLDLSTAADAIDAGGVSFRLAGAFGGKGAEDDNASLTVDFLDAAAGTLGTTTIGGFRATDRGNVTKLLPAVANGSVPPGTRSAVVTLAASHATGPYNDGYADDLSLRLPEPAHGSEECAAAALLAVAAWRGREG